MAIAERQAELDSATQWQRRSLGESGSLRRRQSEESEYLGWLVQQESTVAVALRWAIVLVVLVGAWLVAPAPLEASFWVGLGAFIVAYACFTFLIWSIGNHKNVMAISLTFIVVDLGLASFVVAATGGPRSSFHVLLALLLVRAVTSHPNPRRIVQISVAAFALYALGLFWSTGFGFLMDGAFWFQSGLIALTVPVCYLAMDASEVQRRQAELARAELERALAENRSKQLQLEEALSELRFVGAELDRVSTQLAGSAVQLSNSAQELNESADQVAVTIQQMARGAETQSEQMNNSSKSMSAMSTSMTEVAKGAENAAATASEAARRAVQGGEAALQATRRLNQVKATVADSATAVRGLSEKSYQITRIVDTLNRFADQTTLLALNAAIEAARAGEQGKSFAVIANEIRSLAESSVRSASQISELVQDIQTEVHHSVQSMELVSSEIEGGVVAMERARHSLDQIIDAVHRASELAQEISTATDGQRRSSEGLAKSIQQVANIASRNAIGAEHVAQTVQQQTSSMRVIGSSAQQLVSLAARLHGLVTKLKSA